MENRTKHRPFQSNLQYNAIIILRVLTNRSFGYAGMNRLGLRSGRGGHSVDRTIGRIVAFSRACGAVRFEGLCTHMAEAAVGSDYAQKQASRFHEIFAALVRSGIQVPSVHIEIRSA